MSFVWAICGAGKGVGKTTLAMKLCDILPDSTYAKCGHGKSKPGKPQNYFTDPLDLVSFIRRARCCHRHIVVESNSPACLKEADLVVFMEGAEGKTNLRPDRHRLRNQAYIVIDATAAHRRWTEKLRQAIISRSLRNRVCNLFAGQARYLSRQQPQVRLKIWLEIAGAAVIGGGLAELLGNVDKMQTLQAAAKSAAISYRHAWNMIRNAEKRLGEKLVLRQTGGSGGGKSVLTGRAKQLLRVFKTLEVDTTSFAAKRLADLNKNI